MIGFIQKIILSIITFAIAGFLIYLAYYALQYGSGVKNDPTILIPIILSALSVVSLVFHLKTISQYKDSSGIVSSLKKQGILWYLNLAFGVAVIFVTFFLMFQTSKMYDKNIQSEYSLLIILLVIAFAYGFWICYDYFLLSKKVKSQKSKNYLSQIDEISGRNQKD